MNDKLLQLLNEKYPLHFIKVEAITDEMFRCTAEQGTYYARVTNYKSYEEQVDEVTYTNFLYQEGLAVSPTIASINGEVVERIMLDREMLTVVYQSAPGIHLARNRWQPNVFYELGRQIGRLHRFSKKFEEIHPLNYINDWHDNEEYAFLKYIPKEESAIREIAYDILSTIKKLPKSHSNYGLLHGDLCLENLLIDVKSNFTMIDFQDCEKHFYVFDLAAPIYSAMEYSYVGGGNIVEYGRAMKKAILDGYQEENDLSPEMVDQLPLFIKLKEVFEYSLMHMYWDKDTLTEEQIRIMNHFRIRIEQNHSLLTR
ncbi:phosphotransferase [Bacillus sp. N1-1]|jgi:Ser/Thr protein kinase RdoA (MazF antagonist)|uniref:phosphotransferase enzyme family protein n=1 Tax=Bacillus sp. N1-1 TaxID=2682541 RepID=UPI00131769AE|nr:phosphotransferase [Bacillus sp. N1-1]QHA91039.1 phosphotransferase [Bacillus sp. N1-1]